MRGGVSDWGYRCSVRVVKTRLAAFLFSVLTLYVGFGIAPAHAVCTINNVAGIDGLPNGAAVNCPSGTNVSGGAPLAVPDGSTINAKSPNVPAAGNTSFNTSAGILSFVETLVLTAAAAGGVLTPGQFKAITDVMLHSFFAFSPIGDEVIPRGGPRPEDVLTEKRIAELEQDIKELENDKDILAKILKLFRKRINKDEQEHIILSLGARGIISKKKAEPLLEEINKKISTIEAEIGELLSKFSKSIERLAYFNYSKKNWVDEALLISSERDILDAIENEINKKQKEIDYSEGKLRKDPGYDEVILLTGNGQGRRSLRFTTDMGSLLRRHRRARLLGLNGGALPSDETVAPNPLSWWVSGQYSEFDNDRTGADQDGHIALVRTGVTYKVSPTTSAGIYGRFQHGETRSRALGSKLDGESYGAGVHAGTVLFDRLTFGVGAAYSKGSYDLVIGAVTGDFNTDEFRAVARLSTRFRDSLLWFEPATSVDYVMFDRESYTASDGTAVSGNTQEQGSWRFGGKAGYTILLDTDLVRAINPLVHVSGAWAFANEGDTTLVTGAVFKSNELSVTTGGSLGLDLAGNGRLSFGGSFTDYDNGAQSWSIHGSGSTSFDLPGSASARRGALQLNYNIARENWTAGLKVAVPLN